MQRLFSIIFIFLLSAASALAITTPNSKDVNSQRQVNETLTREVLDFNNLEQNKLSASAEDLEYILKHTNLLQEGDNSFVRATYEIQKLGISKNLYSSNKYMHLLFAMILQLEVADFSTLQSSNSSLSAESFENASRRVSAMINHILKEIVADIGQKSLNTAFSNVVDMYERGELRHIEMQLEILNFLPEEVKGQIKNIFKIAEKVTPRSISEFTVKQNIIKVGNEGSRVGTQEADKYYALKSLDREKWLRKRSENLAIHVLDLSNLSTNSLLIDAEKLEFIIKHTNLNETGNINFVKALMNLKKIDPSRQLLSTDKYIHLMFTILLQMEVADYSKAEHSRTDITADSFDKAMRMAEASVSFSLNEIVEDLNHKAFEKSFAEVKSKYENGEIGLRQMRTEVMSNFPEDVRIQMADIFKSLQSVKENFRYKDIYSSPSSPTRVLDKHFNSNYEGIASFLKNTTFSLSYLILNPHSLACSAFFK